MLYFEDGEIVASSGNVKVYKYEDNLYLEIGPGHNLWMSSPELKDLESQIKQYPKGNCLEIGLGLGMASNYILTRPDVRSLTTIEKSKDVVEIYRQLLVLYESTGDTRHDIITGDVHDVLPRLLYLNKKFDFIFFDHYSLIDEDTIEDLEILIPKAKQLLKENGFIMGWFDTSTPTEFTNVFYNLFKND